MTIFGLEDTKDHPSIITPWAIIHVIAGIVFAVITRNVEIKRAFALFFSLHTIYEIKDVYFIDYQKNSIHNSIGDQISGVCGFFVGRSLGTQSSTILSLVLFAIFLNPVFGKNGRWSNGMDVWTSRG